MSDESFASSQTAAIESLLKTDGFKTVFFTVEGMAYFSEPCELKFFGSRLKNILQLMPFQKACLYYHSSNMPIVKSGNLEP